MREESPPAGPVWNWRTRLRDARFAGLAVLTVGVYAAIAVLQRSHGWSALVGAVIVGVVLLPVGLVALPPWRDTEHGPMAGGLVLAGVGTVVLVVALVVGFGFGVS